MHSIDALLVDQEGFVLHPVREVPPRPRREGDGFGSLDAVTVVSRGSPISSFPSSVLPGRIRGRKDGDAGLENRL